MPAPGPASLGRGVVIHHGVAVPAAWRDAPVVVVDEAAADSPGACVADLHQAWAARRPVVIALGVDASLFRDFTITERVKLQFRTEMFGVTNTPQFSNPGATVSSATRNTDGSIRALNGYGEITGAGGERQIRFAAKVTF